MQQITLWLLVTMVATFTAFAQVQSSGTNAQQPADPPVQSTAPSDTTNQPAPSTTTPAVNQVPPNQDGSVTTPSSPTGPATPSSTTGPTTPVITLGNPSSSPVGASNATPGNQAGASNSTLQPVATSAGINDQQSRARDFAIGGSDSAWAISFNTMGVAEAARLARAARASRKPRVFTNADIARLRGDVPVSVVGNTTPPVTNEHTMPASDVQEQEQSGPTTPAAPQQGVQQQPANQNPPARAPKSPFREKPSPTQPR